MYIIITWFYFNEDVWWIILLCSSPIPQIRRHKWRCSICWWGAESGEIISLLLLLTCSHTWPRASCHDSLLLIKWKGGGDRRNPGLLIDVLMAIMLLAVGITEISHNPCSGHPVLVCCVRCCRILNSFLTSYHSLPPMSPCYASMLCLHNDAIKYPTAHSYKLQAAIVLWLLFLCWFIFQYLTLPSCDLNFT